METHDSVRETARQLRESFKELGMKEKARAVSDVEYELRECPTGPEDATITHAKEQLKTAIKA